MARVTPENKRLVTFGPMRACLSLSSCSAVFLGTNEAHRGRSVASDIVNKMGSVLIISIKSVTVLVAGVADANVTS